ncbi:hypothetical protein KUTG_04716 [Kutzneria sp. 744]|nr:hypothetical protein KUTG_04716 [Kutzneria sp. 744]
MRRSLLLTVVTAGVALAAAGCGGAAGGTASPATDTSAGSAKTTSAAAPAFDKCAVLPQDVLASMGLADPPKVDPDTGQCTWFAANKDGVGTQVGSYPLDKRPDPNGLHPTLTPFTIGSHKAMLVAAPDAGTCGVDLALDPNTTFIISVVALDSKTAPAACDHARALANGAEPKLPKS